MQNSNFTFQSKKGPSRDFNRSLQQVSKQAPPPQLPQKALPQLPNVLPNRKASRPFDSADYSSTRLRTEKRASSPAYSVSSPTANENYGNLFGDDEDELFGSGDLQLARKAGPPSASVNSPTYESRDTSPVTLRRATKEETVVDVYERHLLKESLLEGTFSNLEVKGSTVYFSSDGRGEGKEKISVWSSLMTDLTLRSLSSTLASKSDAKRFRLSFRGESHITDTGIRWLCETLAAGDAIRAKSLELDLDIRQCPGLTFNSVTLPLNIFGPSSSVRSDLLLSTSNPSKPASTPAVLAVSSLLFLTSPELQYSPLRTVKEGRLRPAVRGTVADSQFLEAAGQTKVTAVELCLPAYNIQYFTSQPDQVVIAVENDFDSAVAHVTACLTNFVARENPLLRRKITKQALKPVARPMPVVSRAALIQLKAAPQKSKTMLKKAPTKAKAKKKSGMLEEAQMDMEALQTEYQDQEELVQEPTLLELTDAGLCIGARVEQGWVLPLLSRSGAFLSKRDLKFPNSQLPCSFSVQILSSTPFSMGIGKISAELLKAPQLARLQELFDHSAGLVLSFQKNASKDLNSAFDRVLCIHTPPNSKEPKASENVPVPEASEFQLTLEVAADASDSRNVCMVSIFIEGRLVKQVQVSRSALFSENSSELTHGFVSWSADNVTETMGFCPIEAASQVPSKMLKTGPAKVEKFEEAVKEGDFLHQTKFRVLCRKIDRQRGGAERLRTAVKEALAANVALLEAAASAASKKMLSETASLPILNTERRAAESLAAAERLRRFLESRFDSELNVFDAEVEGDSGGLRELQQSLTETAAAAVSALSPIASTYAETCEAVISACHKAATAEFGGRLISIDRLADDKEINRTFLIRDLDWMHERGIIIFLKRLHIVVTDPTWFFALLESLPFEPPLVAGPLLPGLSPEAGVWSQLELDKSLQQAGLSVQEMDHIISIFKDSGALLEVIPIRESPSDDKLLYTNMFCASARQLDWPVRSDKDASDLGLEAAHRWYRGINLSADRILPALSSLTSHLGSLCCLSARGFVRSLWGAEVCVHFDDESRCLRLTAYRPVDPGAKTSAAEATRRLLWSALHLFTDCVDCLMMRHGVIVETGASEGEPENDSVHSEHSWESQQVSAEQQQSVCSLCGSCSASGVQCSFNRIDSGAPGRCLCGSLAGASCDSCGICFRCASRLWAVASAVRPNCALPGYIDDGDIGDSSRCVRLCPSARLQSALTPEVTFSVAPLESSQPKLKVLLWEQHAEGYLEIYPNLSESQTEPVFSTEVFPAMAQRPIDISFRLSALSPIDDVLSSSANSQRYSFALQSFCTVWQTTGLAIYSFNTQKEWTESVVSKVSLPVGSLIGERSLTKRNDSFEICVVSKGTKGKIFIGAVPAGYPVMSQPGMLPGSIGFCGKDGRVFNGNGSAPSETGFQFSGPEAAPGCHVRCQLQFVAPSRARVLFSVDKLGNGSFEDCHLSEPFDIPPGGLYPCVAMQSPREAVRLTSRIPWQPATYHESLLVEALDKEEEETAVGAQSIARIFPETCLDCLRELTYMKTTFAGVVVLQLLAPGQTEIKVTSPRHVICDSSTIDANSAAVDAELSEVSGTMNRTAFFRFSPKDQENFILLNVLVEYPKEWNGAGQEHQPLEFSEFLRKECSLEIVLSNKSVGSQTQRLKFDIQQEQLRSNSAPLIAVEASKENRRKLGGSCDLLEVFESGVLVRKAFVPRRNYSWVFNASAGVGVCVRAPNFPAIKYSRKLSPGDWLRYEPVKSDKPSADLMRVIKADAKSVTLQPMDASSAAVSVDLSAGGLFTPNGQERANFSAVAIGDPAITTPKFPSPNVLPDWRQYTDLTDGLNIYGQSCRCAGFRISTGFGRSLQASLAKKTAIGHGILWAFLPDLTSEDGRSLRHSSILDVADAGKLRAHLLCNSGSATDVHLVDSNGVKSPLSSALDCHLSAQAAVRSLMQHRLLLPSHELLAGPGLYRPAVETAVRRQLLLGAALSHWRSLAAPAITAEHPEGLEDLKNSLVKEFTNIPNGPLILSSAQQQQQQQDNEKMRPVCRAHQLTSGAHPSCIDELVSSAAAGEGENVVATALATFGSCVRAAIISSRLISNASCLAALSGLESLQLHRIEKMRSLDKTWPMQRLRSLTVTQSDLQSTDCNAPNLRDLTVSIAKVTSVPETCSTKLESLTLDRCPISVLPASIGQLDRLTVLHLLQLPIRSLPPEFANLRALQELTIDGIAWPDEALQAIEESGVTPGHRFVDDELLKPEVTLAGLEPLPPEQNFFNLLLTSEQSERMQKMELSEFWRLVTDVPRLGLDSPDSDPLGGFPPCLFELKNLRELRLSHHAFSQLPDKIGQLKKLRRLTLDHNPLLESLSPRLSELPHFSHVDVSRCPSLKNPPVEVAMRGSAAMLSYLKFLLSDQVECKRTKLMFVGLGGVGKTSLLRALRSPTGTTETLSVEEITDGIDIGDWQIDIGDGSAPLHFSTWDFAGQRVYYNTHQFFLTHRAVYLLLYTVRTGYEHAGLDFWLSSIASHAPKAPILVVGTHADQVEKPDKIPMSMFRSRYPQICGFHIVSSQNGKGVSDLRKQLVEVAHQQPYMSERLPRIFLDFEDRLIEKRTRDRINILDWQEVTSLAQSQGLYEDKHVRQAVSFLNDIGSVQYFDTEYLRQKVVINPKWIVDVMACVVSVKNSPIQNGQLKRSDIPAIWNKFDPELHEWLLKLTEAFDLTYAMKDDCNIVPCLLPEDVPEYSFPQEADGEGNTLARFIYQFDYLPAGLFNRAQVRLFEFTDGNTIWKRGSLLRKDGHIAVITMDERQRLIATVFGPRPENVLFMINDVFDSLIKETFHGVHYEEILPCPECLNSSSGDSELSVIRVAMIRKASSRQVAFLQCPFEFHILNLSQLLANIRPSNLTEFDHQLEQSLLRIRRARLEMTRDVCLLFAPDDYPNNENDKGPACPEAVTKKLEANGLSCYPPYPEQREDKQLHLSDCSAVLVFISKYFGSDKACLNSLFSAKNNLRKRLVYLSVGADKSWRECHELAFLVGTDKYIDITDAKKSVVDEKLAEVVQDATAAVEAATQQSYSQSSMGDSRDVFISYCWANSHDAVAKGTRNGVLGCEGSDPRRLKERLEAEGLRCWLDVKDTGARSLFEDISSGLGRCPLVLAFVSDEYQHSANCMMEFRFAAKNLRKPIVTVVVGQTQAFKTQELGMLSMSYEEFDFRKDVPDADFKRLVNRVKSILASEAENRKAEKPLVRRKTTVAIPAPSQPGLFREEAELAQRRFLKQFSHSDLPRLLVPDFNDVTDFNDDRRGDISKQEKLEDLLLIKVFCENQRGWHVYGPAVSLKNESRSKLDSLLSSASVYLLRICSLLQASGIQLNCLSGVQAEDFMQVVRSEASVSAKSFADAYQAVQQLFIGATNSSQRHSGLSKCALGSGKILWLCPEHQKVGNGRVTVLPNESAGSGAPERFFTNGDVFLRSRLTSEANFKKSADAIEKYKNYLDEQEKYIASGKHLTGRKARGGAEEAKPKLHRHRTSVAIGQLEAAAAAAAGDGNTAAKVPKPRRRDTSGASAAAKADAEVLTASQVSLKKNRSKVCSVQ